MKQNIFEMGAKFGDEWESDNIKKSPKRDSGYNQSTDKNDR